jgi:hypothetical protein
MDFWLLMPSRFFLDRSLNSKRSLNISPNVVIAMFTFAGFVIYSIFAFSFGPIMTPDGLRDIFFADKLISVNLNPFAFPDAYTPYLDEVAYSLPPTNFLIYIYLLSGLRGLLGNEWLAGLLVFNALAQSITTALLLLVVRDLTRNILCIVIAGVFIITGFEFFQWVSMSQSDTLFLLVVTAIFYFLSKASVAAHEPGKRRYFLTATFVATASLFVRPSGIAIASAFSLVMIFLFLRNRSPKTIDVRLFLILTTGVVVCLVAAFVAFGHLLHQPELLGEGPLRGRVLFLKETFDLGWVIWSRPETFVTPPSTPFEYTMLSIHRLYYFFWFIGDTFSFSHKLFNVLYFVPFYTLCLLGVTFALIDKSGIHGSCRLMAMYSLMFIFAIDALHAATILDFDWRFRAPALPGFVILFSIGLRFSLDRIKILRPLVAKAEIGQ